MLLGASGIPTLRLSGSLIIRQSYLLQATTLPDTLNRGLDITAPSPPPRLAASIVHTMEQSSTSVLSSIQNPPLDGTDAPVDEHMTLYDRLSPITDPSKEIRLLNLNYDTGNDIIIGETSVWPLDQAPAFRAISYTWGSPKPRTLIKVDGFECQVRETCAYALWQARYHRSTYVWIDSICINQENHHEKGAQVALMGEIYERAAEVLACIGEADENSVKICDAIFLDIRGADEAFGEELGSGSRYRRLQEVPRILNNWNEFCKRPYFSRVWIVQELFGGRGQIRVLCGTYSIDWDDLVSLQYRMQERFNEETDEEYKKSNARASEAIIDITKGLAAHTAADFQFPSILEVFIPRHCYDPRDRIYGILKLIDWKRFKVMRPVPDYSIPREALALKAVGLLQNTHLSGPAWIAKALEINVEDTLRDIVYPTFPLERSNNTSQVRQTRLWYGEALGARCIYQDLAGRLSIDLDLDSNNRAQSPGAEYAIRSMENRDEDHRSPSAGKLSKEIFTDGKLSVLACSHTLPGDILVCGGYLGTVILRPGSQWTEYGMVGRAIILDGYSIECELDRAFELDWQYSWSPDVRRYPKDAVNLNCYLSDQEALCLGAIAMCGKFNKQVEAFHYASLDFPRPGSVVRDVTGLHWGKDRWIRSLGIDVIPRTSLDRTRNALHMMAKGQCSVVPADWPGSTEQNITSPSQKRKR